MTLTFTSLHAVEILDSRSRPTLLVTGRTAGGAVLEAGVPSGASTGSAEAVELRDGDPDRYAGQGVLDAVAAVNGPVAEAVVGRAFTDLADLDSALRDLDGTPDKSRLGANAVVGVSMLGARAAALDRSCELWQHLTVAGVEPRLPVPHFNVVNGGAHAPNALDFQEFMVAPVGAPGYTEALRAGSEIYGALRARLVAAGQPSGLGDEGGFAPDLVRAEDVLDLLVHAIEDAGYHPGVDGVALAMDPAASEFCEAGTYEVAGQRLSSADLVDHYAELVDRFPVWSIEDGLAEDDWDGWAVLTERLGERVQLVGDDIFVTDAATIDRAVAAGVANAALIKVNQVGTVSETLEAMATCHRSGYAAMVSHRSGETPDPFIADLAVGTGCGQIKSGAPARGERVAKYNRLTQIAASPGLAYADLTRAR